MQPPAVFAASLPAVACSPKSIAGPAIVTPRAVHTRSSLSSELTHGQAMTDRQSKYRHSRDDIAGQMERGDGGVGRCPHLSCTVGYTVGDN